MDPSYVRTMDVLFATNTSLKLYLLTTIRLKVGKSILIYISLFFVGKTTIWVAPLNVALYS